jgi:RNA polymerase sigma factor (sigma-70 family)
LDRNTEIDSRLASLMKSAQDGDGAAYGRLLKEITPLLRRAVSARRPRQQHADVEDLVQDVLLSLHAVRATYDPDRPFLPWLFGIMRNRVSDDMRRQARRAAHEIAAEQVPETFRAVAANTEENTYGDPEALKQAISGLPRGQREAIEMLKLRELSLREAAAAGGTSVGSLKVAVHRAIKTLRRTLSAEV